MSYEEVREVVLRHLRAIVPGTAEAAVDLEASLHEIGADSLDLLDVASRSMEELKVKLPRAEFAKIKTLNDLIEVLRRAATASSAA